MTMIILDTLIRAIIVGYVAYIIFGSVNESKR